MTQKMITVAEADKVLLAETKNYGIENIPFDKALRRVLAEELRADRDLPPYNRVAMDGIAIRYEDYKKGDRAFCIKATQAAGTVPIDIKNAGECIEIMTGAALPTSADTVIRYEDIEIKSGIAIIKCDVTKGQNIHFQGSDERHGAKVADAAQFITPALISLAASIGKVLLMVRKLPRIVIASTGSELVDVHVTPLPHQIRRSNNYIIKSTLQQFAIEADSIHIPDNQTLTREHIERCLQEYDVIIMSGGVSMGKFDYVPQALNDLSVKVLFHKVQQRPGKPLAFGTHPNGACVFALPGNPVSAFMCLQRYFIPWLKASLGINTPTYSHGILSEDVSFSKPLQYFMQVKTTTTDSGQIIAKPKQGNGSGDFSNLVQADAFMELPQEESYFEKGKAYKLWTFNNHD